MEDLSTSTKEQKASMEEISPTGNRLCILAEKLENQLVSHQKKV